MASIEETLRLRKLDEIIGVLKSDRRQTVPILQQIQNLICLFDKHPKWGLGQRARGNVGLLQHEVIIRLQERHALVIVVVNNLATYMAEVSTLENYKLQATVDNKLGMVCDNAMSWCSADCSAPWQFVIA